MAMVAVLLEKQELDKEVYFQMIPDPARQSV